MPGYTVAHMGGIDELAIIWMPLVMGIGLWLIFRTGKDETSQDATSQDATSQEDAEMTEEQ
jgi:ABC-type nickel/cobalt efflux system permease component RcnA